MPFLSISIGNNASDAFLKDYASFLNFRGHLFLNIYFYNKLNKGNLLYNFYSPSRILQKKKRQHKKNM